jgi:predicted Fe-Mo cluster-binding NifX family protein
MKLIVTSTGKDLDAAVDPRFGRAQYLTLVETEGLAFEATENPGLQASGGAGVQAAQLAAAAGARAVLTGNVGPNAYHALAAAGIKVYIGAAGTVRQAVAAYTRGELQEATAPSVPAHAGSGPDPASSALGG